MRKETRPDSPRGIKQEKERIARRAAVRRRQRLVRRVLTVTGAAAVILLSVWGVSTVLKNSGKSGKAAEQYASEKAVLDRLYADYTAGNGQTQDDGAEDTEKKGTKTVQPGFADWLAETYGEPFIQKAGTALKEGTFQEKNLYDWTGRSFIVLADTYSGRLENADTAREYQTYLRGELPPLGEKAAGKGKKEKNQTALLTFAGDLCLAEEGFVLDYYDTVSGLADCISPEILEKTVKSDVFFLNHEYCIGESGEPLEGKFYTFRANPGRMGILEEMGTDLVSLANNHVYDYGPEALLETADRLSQANIPYVGGGRNLEEAKRPIYFVVNGIKVGFVAAERAEKMRYTPEAAADSPGVLLAYDTAQFNQAIAEAGRQCDYLVAYIHWGTEDSNIYETEQHDMAAEFLNSGADAVIGGHPHVLQGIEYIGGKPVVYSLGDFWFNDETKYTGLLELQVSIEGLESMSFVPCLQTGYTTQYLKEPSEQRELFDYLVNLSPALSIDDGGKITDKSADKS